MDDQDGAGRQSKLSLLIGEERVEAGNIPTATKPRAGDDPRGFTCADVQRAAAVLIAIYGRRAAIKAERIRPPGRELFAMMVEREVKTRLEQ